MRERNILGLLLLCWMFLNIREAHGETFSLDSITVDAYQSAILNVNTQDLVSPIYFAQEYGMTILETTTNSRMTFTSPFSNYPFKNITSNLPYFRFRLFNFGLESKIFNITFTCVSTSGACDLSQIEKVLTVSLITPSRAILETNTLFAIVLSSEIFSTYVLPYNLYDQSTEVFLDFLAPYFPGTFDYSAMITDETTFDSSYWNDVNVMTIPWLPFFSHCTNQDKRLLLYDILENSPKNCTYYPLDQIKTVKSFPLTGFTATTDSCHLKYDCFHVQSSSTKSYGTQWYSVTDSKTLYYIYRNAISIKQMIASKSDSNNAKFANLLNQNSADMIPVTFKPSSDTRQSGAPRRVEMTISFFQATQARRDIITVEVVMSDYTGSSNNIYVPYKLYINYKALDYFGMINSFKVGVIVYLIVFLFISLVVLIAVWIIWRVNKFIFARKKKIHPTIKFSSTFRITFFPQLIGSTLATASTVLIFIGIACYFKNFVSLNGFISNFNESSFTTADLLGAKRGRIGVACFFFSMLILKKGIGLLIPVPNKEETKIIVKNLAKRAERKNSQSDSSDSDKSDNSELNESTNSLLEGKRSRSNSDAGSSSSNEKNNERVKIEGATIVTGLKRKQNHVMLVCMFAGIVLLFVVEPTTSTSTDSNSTSTSTFLMIGLMVADVISFLILKHFLMKEILLLAPITTAFEIVQFILVMRAETFVLFIESYLLRTLLIIGFRIYLDPILKNLEVHAQNAWKWFDKRRNPGQPREKQNNERIKWRNVSLILNHPEKDVLREDNSSLEYIVFTLVNFTTKQCARFMFPIYLFFTYVFPNENNISGLFGLNQQQLVYYLLFWLFMLVPCFIMDIFLLNILEIVHGHKLYDYLSYSEYRFNFRTTKWIGSSRKMDRSLSPEHRSIHNFCFSKQFYFTNSVATWGILMFMNGIFIIYANSYKPFADSASIPILLIVSAFFIALNWIFSKLSNYFDIWRLPKKVNKDPCKRIEEEKKRLENNFDVQKMMRTNFFRQFFIRENKDWIINNLKNFIQSENFHDNEGYLLRIYQKLVDEEIRENNEKKRKEYIQQKKYEHLSQLTMKDLDFATEGQRADAGQTQAVEEKVTRIKKSVVKPLTFLLYHWLYFAKQNLYLKSLVTDVDSSNLGQHCVKCGQEYALKLVTQKPLVELQAQFRLQYAGLPFNKYEWRRFYEKKQQFKTLCDDCKFIDLMKKKKIIRTKSRASSRIIENDTDNSRLVTQNQAPSQQHLDPFDNSPTSQAEKEPRIAANAPLKKILLSWYYASKSDNLHKEDEVFENNEELNGFKDEEEEDQADDESNENNLEDDASDVSIENDRENLPLTSHRNNPKARKDTAIYSARTSK